MRALWVWVFLGIGVACLAAPGSAMAEVTRKSNPSTPIDGRFTIGPPRTEIEVTPGSTKTESLLIINSTGKTITFGLKPTDLAPGDAVTPIQTVDEAKHGAVTWLFPEVTKIVVKHGETVQIPVEIRVPPDIEVGTNYAGIVVYGVETKKDLGSGAHVSLSNQLLAQYFLTVPGDLVYDGRIKRFDADQRLIFSTDTFVATEMLYENKGNTTDHIKGKVVFTSLFGNKVRTLPLKEQGVLRDGLRTERFLWNNPPLFGLFKAKIELKTDGGKKSKETGWILIAPPWWWFAIGGAILAVGFVRWYRNRGWKKLLREMLDEEEYDDEDDDEDEYDEEYDEDFDEIT